MSYIMDVGISAPWKHFMTAIDAIEQDLSVKTTRSQRAERAEFGPTALRDLHDTCLEGIRGRLFLRRKQAKFRSAVEDVLDGILKAAAALAATDELPSGLSRQTMAQFSAATAHLVSLLQEAIHKPPKTVAAGGEVETLRLLLGQLDWDHRYSHDAKLVGAGQQ